MRNGESEHRAETKKPTIIKMKPEKKIREMSCRGMQIQRAREREEVVMADVSSLGC